MINAKLINDILSDPVFVANHVSVNKLQNIIEYLADSYYNKGNSLVSDEIYDVLLDILKTKNPNYSNIGFSVNKNKVTLPCFMGSLDKIKNDTAALDTFISKFPGPYILSDKLDGVSALLTFNNNDNSFNLYTRGNGCVGQDITHLIPYVLLKKQLKNIKSGDSDICIRGELIISKHNFKKIQENQDFANARNTVAGLVNSKKNINLNIAKLTNFISYAIVKPILNQYKQMKYLNDININTVHYVKKSSLSTQKLSEFLIKRREEADYEIDGIVVIDSSKIYGNINKNPDHGFAFKTVLTDQIAETTVIKVIWQPSMDGYLKPRIELSPVKLVGVTITFATGFNAKFIQDNLIGVGAVVKLIRSGDVIPHITDIIKPAKSASMPNIPYTWTDTQVDIIMVNKNTSVKVKILSHFMKTLDVKFISDGIITKLIDYGYDSVYKILDANDSDLYEIEGLGKTSIDKIINNLVEALENTNLYTLMAASHIFGRGLAIKKLKLLIENYPTVLLQNEINKGKEYIINKIVEIDGFDVKSATKIYNNINKFNQFFDEINTIVDISHLKKIKKSSNNTKLKDYVIVFTGFRDKDLEKKIEKLGGKITTSVSTKTTHLIIPDDSENIFTNSKYVKAKKLNITILEKTLFFKLL
jgi:DNA ligase (NAD+)